MNRARILAAPCGLLLRPASRAAAALALLLGAGSALAQPVSYFGHSGDVLAWYQAQFPSRDALPDPGVSQSDLGAYSLLVGGSDKGSFSAAAGAWMAANQIVLGARASGDGTLAIADAGTHVDLLSQFPNRAYLPAIANARLIVGGAGHGSATLSKGALVDAAHYVADFCTGASDACQTVVGATAGGSGILLVQDAGTQLNTLHLALGTSWVDQGWGQAGGTATGTLHVTTGALLNTAGTAVLGAVLGGPLANGYETATGMLTLDGAGTQWQITSSASLVADPVVSVGVNQGGTGILTVQNQAQMVLDGSSHANAAILVGDANGGVGSFSVLSGGTVSARYLQISTVDPVDSATVSSVTVDGAGSLLILSGVGHANASTGSTGSPAFLRIASGASGNTGSMTVSHGGRVEIHDDGQDGRASGQGPRLEIGSGGPGSTGNNGSLSITDPDSRVEVDGNTLSLPKGAPDNYNGTVVVGRGAGNFGQVTISNGGALFVGGTALSTLAAPRPPALYIGGESINDAGSKGQVSVSGPGSQIMIFGWGSDNLVSVGRGLHSTGELTVQGGYVQSTRLEVGKHGALGTVTLDGGTMVLYNSYAAPIQGASAIFGLDGGGAQMSLTNGSRFILRDDVPGDGIILGADSTNLSAAGGYLSTGYVTLSGRSSIELYDKGRPDLSVGYAGSGYLRLDGASTISATGSSIYVARKPGSQGDMQLWANSTVSSAYLGIGAENGLDGGSGTLRLDHATVTAGTIEIGRNGTVIGDATTLKGSVINRGRIIPDPPGRPGTLVIDGSLQNLPGGSVELEILSDGQGGFITSHLVFTAGSTVDLKSLKIDFDFLGNTDPAAFLKSGAFTLDTFLNSGDAGTGLSSSFAAGQGYGDLGLGAITAESDSYAISNFSFTPDGSPSFTAAAAVPEPAIWLMLLAGGLAIFLKRRAATAIATSTARSDPARCPRPSAPAR